MRETRLSVGRFVGLFLLLALGFTFLLRLPATDKYLVGPYTEFLARLTTHILNLAGQNAESRGTIISEGSFAVEIRRGCDGIEATILLISACLAYPLSWKNRLWGALWGYGLIFIVNLVRTVGLFYVGLRGSSQTFDFFHTYVSQFAVIALAMVFWIFWISRRSTVHP